MRHTGTVWVFGCPCGRIHERRRRVVPVDVANELEANLAASNERIEQLERELGRCTCPVGFGSVADVACPRHGARNPAHTITGAPSV